MYKCGTCGVEKLSSQFYREKKSPTGLRKQCKACDSAARGRHITPKHKRKRATISQRPADGMTLVRKAEYIDKVKEVTPCASCGCYDHPKAMDYHHLDDSQKLFQIGQIRRHRTNEITLEMIVNEIKKCILLCSRCHRKLHAKAICLLP